MNNSNTQVPIAVARVAVDALNSIKDHYAEFSDIEDEETMLLRIQEKAQAALLFLKRFVID